MKELITNSQDMKKRQIKEERQLNELTNSIDEKFEELEKDKKEKEIKIKNLEEKVSLMSNKIETPSTAKSSIHVETVSWYMVLKKKKVNKQTKLF